MDCVTYGCPVLRAAIIRTPDHPAIRKSWNQSKCLAHQELQKEDTEACGDRSQGILPHLLGFELLNHLAGDIVRAGQHTLHQLPQRLLDLRIHPLSCLALFPGIPY